MTDRSTPNAETSPRTTRWFHALDRPSIGTISLIALALLAGGILLASSASADSLGDRVMDGDGDHLPVLTDAPTHTVCRTTGAAANADYYIVWDNECDEVDRHDVRLTDTDGGDAGTAVASGDDDRNEELRSTPVIATNEFDQNVGFIEADGIHGFDKDDNPAHTEDDWIYLSTDGTLGVNDIRLTDSDGGNAGTLVESGDDDLDDAADEDSEDFPISRTFERYGNADRWHLKYYDVSNDGEFTGQEDVLILVQDPDSPFAGNLDIALTSAGAPSFGDMLEPSDAIVPHNVFDVGDEAYLAVTDEVDSPWKDRHFFIHFQQFDDAGDDRAILENDIILQADSGSLGDRVTSTSEGQGERIDETWALADLIYFLDIDGLGTYTPGEDPVYIHKPDGEGGDETTLSQGDIRLTDFEGFNAGTVVESGDSDLVAYGGDTANPVDGEWFIMLHNADQAHTVELERLSDGKTMAPDGDWVEDVDAAYISDSNEVSDGDTRLYAPNILANSIVSCDEEGEDLNHSDCSDWEDLDGDSNLANVLSLNSTDSNPSFPGTSPIIYQDSENGDTSTFSDDDILLYHPDIPSDRWGDDLDTLANDFDVIEDEILGQDSHRVEQLRSTNGSAPGSAAGASFTVGTDPIYYDDDSFNVTDGDVRMFYDWADGDVEETLAPLSTVRCEGEDIDHLDLDCASDLNSDNNIKVTGTDGDWDGYGAGEFIYYSFDDYVNEGDFRFIDYGPSDGNPEADGGAGERVDADDPDVSQLGVGDDDHLYISWCDDSLDADTDCDTDEHPTDRVRIGDVQLGDDHEIIDATSNEYDVELHRVDPSDQFLKRYDRGTSIGDDTFYLSFDSQNDRITTNDLRLLSFGDHDAGTMVQSGDDDRLTSGSITTGDDPFEDYIRWVDRDGDGYDDDDPVYVSLKTQIFDGADFDELNRGDIRLTEISVGDSTFGPGTMVFTGDADRSAFDLENEDNWNLYWHDTQRNGEVELGDQIYLTEGTIEGNAASLFSIRLSGEADAVRDTTTPSPTPTDPDDDDEDDTDPTTPPSISITTPDADATFALGDEVHINGTASAGDAALDGITLTVNDETLPVSGLSSWSATWTPDEVGDYTISVTVEDADGESAVDSVTVTIEDPTPVGPTVSIDSHEDGATATEGEQVSLSGTAERGDAAITSLRLTAEDRSLNVRGIADWTGTWTPQQAGDIDVTVTVSDADGNTATDSVTFNVQEADDDEVDDDTVEPIDDEEVETPGFTALAAILAAIAVVARRLR